MITQRDAGTAVAARPGAREQLLAAVPVTEDRVRAAGIETAVLRGGDGPPLVLLHGPGESAANWLRVIPELVQRHRVVAPDLPAHGRTEVPDGPPDAARVVAWVHDLIAETCPGPPALVGHVLGGAIAARYVVAHGARVRRLVLVDALGLAPFRPAPAFLLTMIGFQLRPTERSYHRFMRQCSYDLDALQAQMGERWEPFVRYNLQLARRPEARAAGRLMRLVGLPTIPPVDLARVTVPTTLIWGRHDRALRLRIAQSASARYGWPLHVIEECADDPPRDRPAAFLAALRSALDGR